MPETNTEAVTPPPVAWAQTKGVIFLTVLLEDCKEPSIKLEPERMFFKGVGGTSNKLHEVTLDFFKDIIPEDSKQFIRDRSIEFILKKKEEGPYWKRLLKEDKKFHWLKVDFNKWKDEDDSDVDDFGGMNPDLEDVMKSMGGLDSGGDKASLDDLADEDSDDEDLPDLE